MNSKRKDIPFTLAKLERPEFLTPENLILDTFIHKNFCQFVPDNRKELYKVTVAIAEYFGDFKDDVCGILYPSIACNGNTDNIALKKDVFNTALTSNYVEYVEVAGKIDDVVLTGVIDFAHKIDDDGNIIWED